MKAPGDTRPADVVLCASPNPVGAFEVFSASQCEVVHEARDEDGRVPMSLCRQSDVSRSWRSRRHDLVVL
jgi:hypothetical protein